MDGTIARFIADLIARLDGPLHFRIILQPAVAAFFAVRDGFRDARNNEPLYFRSLFTDPALRPTLIRNGLKSIAKLFIVAVLLDCFYQVIVLRWFYPFESLLVAIVLALLPYVLLRGFANRMKHVFGPSRVSRSSVVQLTARAGEQKSKSS